MPVIESANGKLTQEKRIAMIRERVKAHERAKAASRPKRSVGRPRTKPPRVPKQRATWHAAALPCRRQGSGGWLDRESARRGVLEETAR